MKKGWEVKKLGDVCEVLDSKRKPITKRDRIAGKYPYYGATGILDYVHDYIFNEKLILIGEDGAKWGAGENTAFIAEGKYWVNNHAHVIRPDRSIVLDNWIVYFLNFSDLQKYVTGLTVPKLNQEKMRGITLPLPPLPEQKRIVGILDKAFAAISTAKANAEKNLQNARELFESYLQGVFANPGDGWEEKTLGEIATVKGGKRVPKGYRLETKPTKCPYIRVTDFNDNGSIDLDNIHYINEEVYKQIKNYTISTKDLYISIAGTIGKTGIIPKELDGANLTENACKLVFKQDIEPKFVYYFTKSRDFLKQAGLNTRVAAMPKLALTRLSTIKFFLPISLNEQRSIVAKLNAFSAETKKLEVIYQQKIADFEELKKSVLQKAFSGQLTAGESTQSVSVAIPFPQTIPNISTTDLHAGVLAMACELHEKNNKLKYFAHVKAEKIAHMVEAWLGIDLGRKPVKDAAGPNDFPHLLKVEHRARTANYFDFKRVDGGAYQVHKLRGFERLIDKTRILLGQRLADVERLLQWMLPMTMKQAVIVATVYTAWNNLLLDGREPTDEEIVREARKDWHPDKLKIEREKFFKAVGWLREQGVVPEGKGQRVVKKAE